jgi:phosphate transport system permease protein
MYRKLIQSGLPKAVIYLLSAISIAVIVFIFLFVFYRAWPVIRYNGMSLITTGGFDTQLQKSFDSPNDAPILTFGLLGLVYGTLMTTLIALMIATLIGLGAAITISEYAMPKIAGVFIAIVRLLAAVPSVVFGLVGLLTVVPFMQNMFEEHFKLFEQWNYAGLNGRNMVSAIVVLTFMIVPTVTSLSVDAIRAVPNDYRRRATLSVCGSSASSAGSSCPARAAASSQASYWRPAEASAKPSLSLWSAAAWPSCRSSSMASSTSSRRRCRWRRPSSTSRRRWRARVDAVLFSCGAILLVIGALLSIGARAVNKQIEKAAGYDD